MILKAHVHVVVKYQRSSLQWISKYKVTKQIISSSKFILVTQKGILTKDKFDSFFPVYIKQHRDFDGLINITKWGHSALV